MPVFVVADLHGASDALPKAIPEGSTLLLLGDLLNVLDYIELSGILVEVFTKEAVAEVANLRTAGRLDEARAVMAARSKGREDEVRQVFSRLAVEQYDEVFTALPDPTYLILGNVDIPAMADGYVTRSPGVTHADGQTIEIEGERFGFVGGALPTPLHVAGEVSAEDMRAKIEGLGEVDVLCSHIPPAVPDLCFDTLASKSERGSEDLLAYIMDVQPRRAYFGHVHQPLVSSMWLGDTLCMNVGYFRRTKRAVLHAPATKGEEPWPRR
jgi:Icc-related predicted phosphoesterase